jgi:hypothetical protein
VVGIDVDGIGLCAGALVASNVVLTARRCVDTLTGDAGCPAAGAQVTGPRPPATLRILSGDEGATPTVRARGYQILDPPGDRLCGSDVAVLLLDASIDDRVPLKVRATAPAKGDHLRTVTFDSRGRVVRDHVLVADTSATEVLLEEPPCRGGPGGPAIDEQTGEIVGVFSRSEPACEAAIDRSAQAVYTRLDAQAAIVAQALAFAKRGVSPGAAKEKKGPVDLGASCARGADCAAGSCVTYGGAEYCSRTCGAHDKCPAHFKCMQSVGRGVPAAAASGASGASGTRVCVES